MILKISILSVLLLILFLLINKEGFTNQNLDYYYKDIVPSLYKYDEDSLTFKDVPNCSCGYLKIKNTDIANRDPIRYSCPNDPELKPLLREYLIGEDKNTNVGWRNVAL
jgi:hypothetical protein